MYQEVHVVGHVKLSQVTIGCIVLSSEATKRAIEPIFILLPFYIMTQVHQHATSRPSNTFKKRYSKNLKMHTLSWQIPILILALWLFTAYMTRAFPTLTGKRICLVIAHPDDEAMFFAPTIRHLTRPELGNQIVILCFSSGDADGLGHIRKKELVASALLLGLRKPEHIVVIEDEKNFPDSMTTTWDAKLISQTLMKYFAPSQTTTTTAKSVGSASASATSTTTSKKQKAAPPPETLIDVLITFDEGGISGHPNHISLLHGCTTFLRTLMLKHTGWENPVKLYTLTTTNMMRKYSSVLDSLVSVLAIVLGKKERGAFASPLLMVSLPGDVRKAQQAMTTAHVSQMRWFRWGWIGISRYMVINDLKKR